MVVVVPIWLQVVPLVERSTLKPVSLVALSVHVRLIWVLDVAMAVSPVGSAGSGASVVALAMLL